MGFETATMETNRAPHASPACSEADRAGTFLSSGPSVYSEFEMVERIRLMGVTVGVEEESLVLSALRTFGFRRVWGFGSLLAHEDAASAGVPFARILEAIALDEDIRLLLLEMIGRVEVSLRAILSQRLAERYGPFALHERSAFRDERHFDDLQHTLDRESKQGKAHRYPFVVRDMSAYGALPIWTELELTSFGTASKLYRNLADAGLSNAISKRFRLKPRIFSNWLHYLTQVRNMCAHHYCLYGYRFAFTPRLFNEHADVDKQRLFPVFIVLFTLADSIDSAWADACRIKLDRMMRGTACTDLSQLGFPRAWRTLLGLPGAVHSGKPRARGRCGGRPAADPQVLAQAMRLYDSKELTVAQISELTGLSQSVIYKYARLRREEDARNVEYAVIPL